MKLLTFPFAVQYYNIINQMNEYSLRATDIILRKNWDSIKERQLKLMLELLLMCIQETSKNNMLRATACMKQLQDKTKRFLGDNSIVEEKQLKAYFEYSNFQIQSAKKIIVEALQQQKKGKVDKIGIARTLLLKAMITEKLKQPEQTLQAIKSAICYLQLKRISKFQLPQHFTKLGQILILQLHIAVNKLEILKYQQATMIYLKGLKIAENTLGSEHKLTKLMKDIKKNRKATQQLFKSLSKEKLSSARTSQKFRMKKNRHNLRIKTEISEGNSIDSKKYCKQTKLLPKRKKGFQIVNLSYEEKIQKDSSVQPKLLNKSHKKLLQKSKDIANIKVQQKLHINLEKLANYPSKIIQREEQTPINQLQIIEPKKEIFQLPTVENERCVGKLINQRELLQKAFQRSKIKSQCQPPKNEQQSQTYPQIGSSRQLATSEQQKSYCSLI